MKKFIYILFGKELKWFLGLHIDEKVSLVYCIINLCFLLCLSNGSLFAIAFFTINFLISLIYLVSSDIEELDDDDDE